MYMRAQERTEAARAEHVRERWTRENGGGRTPISRGVWDRGPEMRPAGAALPFALSHLCRAALQTECPDEASVPDDRDDGQSERWSTIGN